MYQLISLRDRPQDLKIIAEWIHRQWWAGTSTPPDAIERWLSSHLGHEGFPMTLVAVADDEAIASVTLHETEAEDRPAYRPYLGALFVKPGSRRLGMGAALVRAVEAQARSLGFSQIHLNAADPLVGFYGTLGWVVVERNYGPKRLNILRRDLAEKHEAHNSARSPILP
jgi:GNAT superfamily N-acetyltransferase